MHTAHARMGKREALSAKSLITGFVLMLMLALSLCVTGQSAWAKDGTWSGTGTETDPYLIEDAADLTALSEKVFDVNAYSGNNYRDTYFALANDIDLGGAEFQPIGRSTSYPFSGVFDGKGHTVSGLSIKSYTPTTGTGLFGCVSGTSSSPAVVKNLVVQGDVVSSTSNTSGYVGGVIGLADKYVLVQNVGNEANVTLTKGHYAGGVVGSVGTAKDNWVRIEDCYNAGTITVSTSSSMYVGGVVGKVNAGTAGEPYVVKNCYNTGAVTSPGKRVGGVVGYTNNNMMGAQVEISNCYNTGTVTADSEYGSVVGTPYTYGGWDQANSKITNCYATSAPLVSASVSGYDTSNAFTITNCGVKTAEEMASADFVSTLGSAYISGETAPILAWQASVDEPPVVAMQVVVKGADGTEESRVDITKSELEALASDSEEAALGQYFKNGKWTVLSSDSYALVSDILEQAGVEAEDWDKIGFESGGEAYTKWSATMPEAESGAWYPNAASTDDLGEAAEGTLPFAIALSYSKGSGATVADAQAQLAPADGNVALMGIYDAAQQGGNRFCSNISAIVVQRVDPVVMNVIEKDYDGNVIQTVELTKSELEALASDSEEAALGQYFKNGKWTVLSSDNYVLVASMFEASGIELFEKDVISYTSGGEAYTKWSATMPEAESGAWYPNAASTDDLGEAAEGTLPFAIALSYSKGSGATVADAQAQLAPADGNVALCGIYTDDNDSVQQGGNRFCSNIDGIVVTHVKADLTGEWITDSHGKWYFYDAETQKVQGKAWPENEWALIDGAWYHFDADGYMQTGWIRADVDITGSATPGNDDAGAWYILDDEGKLVTGDWRKDSKGWCYVDAVTGEMWFDSWTRDSSGPCYIGHEGYCLTGWFIVDTDVNGADTPGAWYYADSAGCVKCGNWYKDSHGWCYTDPNTGMMWTNRWASDSAGPCYIGSEGYCLTGWFQVAMDCEGNETPDAWYHSNASGQLDRGNWMEDSIGWCYLDPETGEMWTNSWVKDSAGWCFVGSDGYCVTGKQTIESTDGQSGNPGAGTFVFNDSGQLTEIVPNADEPETLSEVAEVQPAA